MARFKTTALLVLCTLVLAPAARAEMSVPYPTTHQTDRPIVITIHGGGWAGRSNEQTRPLAERLHRMGYPVINAAYRLACYGSDGVLRADCPHLDKLVLDIRRQVRWARVHHAELGTSSGQVILMGLSAGGHLATLLTARGIADAAIGFSAPTSLPTINPYLEENVNGLVGCPLSECRAAWRAASATSYKSTRPMFLAYGQHEWMVPPESQGDPMRRADPNAKIVRLAGIGHCCTDNWEYGVLPEAIAYVSESLAGERGGQARSIVSL